MREYGKVHWTIWANKTMRGLDSDARLLAIYLLTSPHTHSSGVFRLPNAYACDDLGWDAKRLRNCFEALSKIGFAERCQDTDWVWICKFHEWNRPDNPNIRKAIVKHVQGIPSGACFREKVLRIWEVSETVSKPLGNSPSPSPSPSLLLKDGNEFQISPDMMAEFRAAYPTINIVNEIAKMRAWLVANPDKRKTDRGTPRFINNWLSSAKPDAADPTARPRLKEL